MMKPVLTILFVALLSGFTACTSVTEVITITVIEVAADSSPTNTPTTIPVSETETSTPTPSATPIFTYGPTATLLPEQATATVEAILTEIATLQMTPPTSTPSATPTYDPSTPSPNTWRILFRGGPCEGYCTSYDLGNEDLYFINSDSSGLIPVSLASDGNLAQQVSIAMNSVRFSYDTSMLAYMSSDGIQAFHFDGTEAFLVDSLPANIAAFDFLPDNGCFVGYLLEGASWETTHVVKGCTNQPDYQILATFQIPELQLIATVRHLSPNGDALLIYGPDNEGGVRLYIKNLLDNSPPLLVYHQENVSGEYKWSGPIRWWPDGQTIEFVVIGSPTTFYTLNRNGENLIQRFSLREIGFQQGDWSPDGHQFVFEGITSAENSRGLYLLEFENNKVTPLLTPFFIDHNQLIAWMVE